MSTPTEPTTPAVPTGEPTPAAPAAPAAPQQPAPQAPAANGGEPQDVASLPQWAQTLIANTRQEAAGHRTRANAAEQQSQATLDGIARALGLTTEGTPDPAQVSEQLTQAQAAHRQQLVENAVLRAAGRLGANADALLDSRAFAAQLSQLDPAASDFSAVLEAAIQAATAGNPAFAVAQPAPGPGRSGTTTPPAGAGTQTPARPSSLSQAIRTRLGS